MALYVVCGILLHLKRHFTLFFLPNFTSMFTLSLAAFFAYHPVACVVNHCLFFPGSLLKTRNFFCPVCFVMYLGMYLDYLFRNWTVCTLFLTMKGEGFSSTEYYYACKIVYIEMRLGALLTI